VCGPPGLFAAPLVEAATPILGPAEPAPIELRDFDGKSLTVRFDDVVRDGAVRRTVAVQPRGASAAQERTDGVAESVIGGVFKLAQEIANAVAEAMFEPLLPRSPGPGMDNVAQAWCEGFLDGMALDDDAWDPLVEDPSANRLLTPIFALALANMFDDDSTPDPAATADLVAMRSTVVPLIPEY
jgi:hypothetical protein